MKTIYVADLYKSQTFENETFAIFDATQLEDKNGKPYYNLTIGDKTGRLQAKIWSDSLANINKKVLKQGKLISISGKVDEYRGNLQVTIVAAEGVDDGQMEEYVNSSKFSADEMYDEIIKIVSNFENKNLSKVVLKILRDKDIERRFKYWPAATVVHHEFRSGLIQHILEMITVANGLERFYPDVDFDVLNTGIILHDIGKLYELDATDMSVPYTTEGMLLGHIYIGAKMFENFAKDSLDNVTKLHVVHLILSHHGKQEYGAPVVPATVEAQLLHYIDNVSAKARTADSIRTSLRDDEEFSSRSYWLENAKIWNPKKLKGQNSKVDEEEENGEEDQIPLV